MQALKAKAVHQDALGIEVIYNNLPFNQEKPKKKKDGIR